MKKRCLSWLLSMVMAISLFPVSAATTFAADVTGATDLSLNDAETVLNSNGIYKVAGDQAGKTIKITDNASITLLVENATLSAETSPIQVENGATLTLVVADNSTNTITCTATTADETNKGMTAGISVPDGATLTVDTPDGGKGNGELTINGGYGGAGIGGGSAALTAVRQASGGKGDAGEKAPDANANSAATTGGAGGDGGDGGEGGCNGADATSAGSVTVKAGVITANGGEGAAGIGGGYGKDGENGGAGHPGVKGSDGGVRQAYYQAGSASGDGGYGGSGAGGNGGDGGTGGNGGQVVISGGTVTAVGNNAAGIGGGKGGNGGTGGNGGESQSDTVNSVTTSQNILDVWSYGGGSGTGGSGENGHGGYAGNGGNAGTLQITGGRVTAKGSVGFGGGSAGSNGNDGNTPAVARARHHGYIVFNNHGLGYRRTDTNENTLVVSGSSRDISACASAGGLPGNGGTAAARDAKTAINGA